MYYHKTISSTLLYMNVLTITNKPTKRLGGHDRNAQLVRFRWDLAVLLYLNNYNGV